MAIEEMQSIRLGEITYLDTGETIAYPSVEEYLSAYSDALDDTGPRGIKLNTLTNDLDIHYRAYCIGVMWDGHQPVPMEEYLRCLAEGEYVGYIDHLEDLMEADMAVYRALKIFLGDKGYPPGTQFGIEHMREYGFHGLESNPMLPLSPDYAEALWREDAPIHLLRQDNSSLPVTDGQQLHDWCSSGGMAGILATDWAQHHPPSDFYQLEGGAQLELSQSAVGFDYTITRQVKYPLIGERVRVLHRGSLNNGLLSTSQAVQAISAQHGMKPVEHTLEKEGSIGEMAMTRKGRLQFSEEQYKTARYDASALEYARAHSYDLMQQGQHYYLRDHDSMVFTTDGRWYWNSRGVQGGAIELLMHYEGMSLPQAVLTLCGEDAREQVLAQTGTPGPSPAPYRPRVQAKEAERVPFSAPSRGKNYKRMFAYLASARGLDYDIVAQMVKEKRVYPTEYRLKGKDMMLHNVVFAGIDSQGVIRSAFQRGSSDMSDFKMEVAGSDKSVPFVVPGRQDARQLYVFEAAIDALSHASIQKLTGLDWQQAHRLSQGGNAPIESLTKFLQEHPQVTQVFLCMDSDAAGQKLAQLTGEKLVEAGYGHLQIRAEAVPLGKDWNDYLRAWRGVINDYEKYPTTQEAMHSQQNCVGRIHTLDERGKVVQSAAFTDRAAFRQAVDGVGRQAPIVVETPEQIAQVGRMRERRQAAQQQAQTSPGEEAELGG